ncbi:DinB family protein [Rubripirellula amarantea]|nr:DinB family protein [Rubripirellula amarantea]
MAQTIGPMIAASARLPLSYAERLLGDIPDEKFSAFARTADGLIESNHPAFVCGHLSLYASVIVSELGQDASSIEPSEEYLALFSKTATCQDDLERKVYPPAEELKSTLFDGYRRAIEVLEQSGDAIFSSESPNERMRQVFPTLGALHMFYVGGHFMLHMGQVSAWRRAVGYGPA